MNINELSSMVHGTSQINTLGNYATSQANQKSITTISEESFENIFKTVLSEEDVDTTKLSEEATKIKEAIYDIASSKEVDTSDVISILTDAEKAKEYLSSASGRELILAMSENLVSDIITSSL